jgi:hypothetical protein
MLAKTAESKNPPIGRESTGSVRRETLWAAVSFVTSAALFPVVLSAQVPAPGVTQPTQASGFGAGVQTPLRFAGDSGPENQITLNLGAAMIYDDNVLATNVLRISDEALSLRSQLGVARQTEHLKIDFNYNPFYQLYRQTSELDRLNHAANLSLTYLLASRWSLGLHDGFTYQKGAYPSVDGQQIMAGLTPPTALNESIYSPTARTLSNGAGLDLMFAKSQRTTITFSGGYNERKFASQTVANQPLFNSTGWSGSVQVNYAATEYTTVGVVLLHQNSSYQGGQVFGNQERSRVESVYLSLSSRLSPTVTVAAYGGPQYVRLLGQSSPGSTLGGSLQGSGGGSITKQVHITALNLSVQRSVSDGGGLYTSVINTSATFGVRRRLFGLWEGNLHGVASRVDASLALSNAKTGALAAGINLSRPFSNGSVFHIDYDTTHESTTGATLGFANFDRNQVTIGFDFRVKTIAVGQ